MMRPLLTVPSNVKKGESGIRSSCPELVLKRRASLSRLPSRFLIVKRHEMLGLPRVFVLSTVVVERKSNHPLVITADKRKVVGVIGKLQRSQFFFDDGEHPIAP
jgi:hypothetical protein